MPDNDSRLITVTESIPAVEAKEIRVADLKLPEASSIAPMPIGEERPRHRLPPAGSIAAVAADGLDYREHLRRLHPDPGPEPG